MGVKLPVTLRCSVATVKAVVIRSTLGVLKSALITTFATTDGVRRIIARTCMTVKAAVTACKTRGVKTKGMPEVHRNFGTYAVLNVNCSLMTTAFVVAMKGCVACLFISRSISVVVDSISVCLGYVKLFFVPLTVIGVCEGKVRKLNCKLLPVVTNITRLVKENIMTQVTTEREDCLNIYLTDPTT